MKVVILCGGYGTRLAEETKIRPKPMVKIGNLPILIHLMNYYCSYGHNEFILALGYKGNYIKKFFKNYKKKNFHATLIDTGKSSLTGGRLLRLKKYLINEKSFMVTYGDGLSNINLNKLKKFHQKHKKIATLSAVRPPARFGELFLKKKGVVSQFKEKPQTSENWINGGFFLFNNNIFDYLKNDKTILERDPFQKLSKKKELRAFKHYGFWQCMDTLRDKILLNQIWKSKKIPWIKKI
tara:strand:- start:15 stop:728 length:714 start_codon:yes stop_codon:yes gene_type:complete